MAGEHPVSAVEAIEKSGSKFVVHARQQEGKKTSFTCDLAVHAAGRVPDIDDLDLERAQVEREKRGAAIRLRISSNGQVRARRVDSTLDSRLAWLSMAPLGKPVVPLV